MSVIAPNHKESEQELIIMQDLSKDKFAKPESVNVRAAISNFVSIKN